MKINAPGLKPLPLRAGVRTGERVYCLSHPGGYYFMFTQGMVARLNRKRNEVLDEHGHTNGLLTRPILFLNVTAEFAPAPAARRLPTRPATSSARSPASPTPASPPLGTRTLPLHRVCPCASVPPPRKFCASPNQAAGPPTRPKAPTLPPSGRGCARRIEGVKAEKRPVDSLARPPSRWPAFLSCRK